MLYDISIECCELKPINTQSAHVQMKVVIRRRLVPFSHMPLLCLYVNWNLIVVAPCGLLRLHGQARVDYRKENLKAITCRRKEENVHFPSMRILNCTFLSSFLFVYFFLSFFSHSTSLHLAIDTLIVSFYF
uniref:Uncharacterized protein n=1 Tax=Glossina palpalis gambiensis TaxID=67801 RepID=A0A1B0BA48_9MUSC